MSLPGSRSAAKVSAVILAAGASRRMGRAKPLLPIAAEPMIRRVAQRVLAAGLEETLVIVGHQAAEVTAVLADLPLRIVKNTNWRKGQSASVATAVGALPSSAGAALFVPCDLPHLTPGLLRDLISVYRCSSASIVVPTADGQRRSPVLVDPNLFPELLTLTGDQGARQIFSAHADEVLELPVTDPRVLDDIDTRADYERLMSEVPPRAPGNGR